MGGGGWRGGGVWCMRDETTVRKSVSVGHPYVFNDIFILFNY